MERRLVEILVCIMIWVRINDVIKELDEFIVDENLGNMLKYE